MVIAIDFDGTIVEDAYPEIGEPKMFAFETLRELQKDRHQLILWTTRSGAKLQDAISHCAKHGIEFYAHNQSFPEEKFDGSYSRKLNCELFISHKNVGGLLGWGEAYQEIKELAQGKGKLYGLEGESDAGFFRAFKNFFNSK
ncbi:MAG: hydrolase [Flavobacteriales bacterium]|nr:hydrolase [Flavobacteriales bacterium]